MPVLQGPVESQTALTIGLEVSSVVPGGLQSESTVHIFMRLRKKKGGREEQQKASHNT